MIAIALRRCAERRRRGAVKLKPGKYAVRACRCLDQRIAVLDRELRDRGLVRGQEGSMRLDRRQRLPVVVRLRARPVFWLTPVMADIVALISSNVRTPMSRGRGGSSGVGGRPGGTGERTLLYDCAERVEASGRTRPRRALLERDDRADRRQRLAGLRLVVRVVITRVEQAIRLADARPRRR